MFYLEYLAVVIKAAQVINMCTGLHNVKVLVEKTNCSFIDKLISDVRFFQIYFQCIVLIYCIGCSFMFV